MALTPSVAVWTVTPNGLPFAHPASTQCLEAGRTPPEWPARPLLEVLQVRHPRDAWFQAVTCPGASWPRLAKSVLRVEPELAATLTYAVVDLDRPDHRADPWPDAATAAEAVRHVADRLDCSVYATRGGLRAVWLLAKPIPIRLAQSFLDQLHERLPSDLPVPVDRGVRDWTRGFRVAWGRRADGKAPAWGDVAPPSDLRRLEDGEALAWCPPLQVEQAVELRRVVWPSRSDAPSRVEQRIEGIARYWADRIAEAPSRHRVLLTAGRLLGGLCAGHGVSPEAVVEILATASNSNNARKTAQTAVDYGAHEPLTLGDAGDTSDRRQQAFAGGFDPAPRRRRAFQGAW